MSIDMNQCVFGDRLKTRGGEDAVYLACHEWDGYRHRVTVAQEDGEYYVRDDGLFTYSREHSADIVEILPREQPAQKWPKPCCGDVPDELKCPWCESTYVRTLRGDPITGDPEAFCVCENCGLSGPTSNNVEQAEQSFRLLKRSDKP